MKNYYLQKHMKSFYKRRNNMFPYIPHTPEDEKHMLSIIGVEKIEDLFADIPPDIRLDRPLALEDSKSEWEVMKQFQALSKKNKHVHEYPCFIGAGAYDHWIPSIVNHLASRSEFVTAYTPYQPEVSQGTLQVIYEYQTMICQLTDMDVSNASLYDGASACAEAALMAANSKRRKKILVSKTVHPEVREVLATYMKYKEIELVEISETLGVTDIKLLEQEVDSQTAGVIIQNPNFFGNIENMEPIEKIVHKEKAFLIMHVDPISLGILKSPGDWGADIVVGEGQALGNPLQFGGPYLGFIAATSAFMRKMPGRIVGETVDVDGRRGFVLTLQTREQHIRREKATSNITSNQALNALRAVIYLSTLGPKGLRDVAKQSMEKAHYAFEKITQSGKYEPLFSQPFFKEFAIKCPISPKVIEEKLLEQGILGGYSLEKLGPNYENCLLLCVTEKRSKEEIDRLVEVMEGIV